VKQLPVLADVPKGAGTIKYPRPVEAFHQIEVTTFCNLRCVYCPSRHLDRPKYRNQPKQDMELAVYERALEWCSHFAEAGTQKELSITGIGETLMHPEWRTMVRLAREALPEAFINFSTNGLLLDDEACEVLAEQSCGVYVSLHRPEKAGPAIECAKKHGILVGLNDAAATSAFDWAGQLDWIVSAPPDPCGWLGAGWAAVLVDGRVTTCCLDAAAKGVVGHVDDEIEEGMYLKPYSLCNTCHMTVP
jgi:Radical SAM superfamily